MGDTSGGKALKAGIWYTIANFLSKGIVFLSMPLFTRLLSKSEVGDYANFSSWLSIVSSIITLDLFSSVALAKFDFKERFKEYISSILLLGSLFTLLVYFVCFFFKDQINTLLGFSTLEFNLLFIVSIFSPAMSIFEIKNRVEYKYKPNVIVSLGSTVLCVITSLSCCLLFENRLKGRLLGYYIPVIFIYICIFIYLFRPHNSINPSFWKYSLFISVPLIVHVLSGRLLSSCDRVMIKRFCGNEETALYSVAYSCTIIISVFMNSVNSAWTPWALEQMNNKNYDTLKKASRVYLLFMGAVFAVFMLVAPEILLIMGGKEYRTSIGVIPPVLLGYVFQFVYSLYVNVETILKKQKYIAIGSSIAAIANILLNIIFIPLFGYVAAAYTTLIGYVLLFWIHFVIVKKLGKASWYDTKFNILYIGIFCAALPIFILLYSHKTLRYSTICIIVITLLYIVTKYRKVLLQAIKTKSITPVYATIISKESIKQK